jgi:hypothetical protein
LGTSAPKITQFCPVGYKLTFFGKKLRFWNIDYENA